MLIRHQLSIACITESLRSSSQFFTPTHQPVDGNHTHPIPSNNSEKLFHRRTLAQGVEKKRRENEEYEAVKFWLVFKCISTRTVALLVYCPWGAHQILCLCHLPQRLAFILLRSLPCFLISLTLLSVKPILRVFRLVLQLVTHGRGNPVAPSIPKFMAQSVEGQTPLDKGDLNGVASHFLFPPTNTATFGL